MQDSTPPLALTLPPDLGIEQVTALRAMLLAHVQSEAPVSLTAPQTARVHTAALQLLAMFWRDREAAGRPTRWLEVSDALRGAAAVLGLIPLLHLERELP